MCCHCSYLCTCYSGRVSEKQGMVYSFIMIIAKSITFLYLILWQSDGVPCGRSFTKITFLSSWGFRYLDRSTLWQQLYKISSISLCLSGGVPCGSGVTALLLTSIVLVAAVRGSATSHCNCAYASARKRRWSRKSQVLLHIWMGYVKLLLLHSLTTMCATLVSLIKSMPNDNFQ